VWSPFWNKNNIGVVEVAWKFSYVVKGLDKGSYIADPFPCCCVKGCIEPVRFSASFIFIVF
jgi:hypothetical protein